MTRWIRWQGVLGFVAIVALIGVFWVLLIDTLVEKGVEAAGTKMVGARVELAEADVTFAPLGIALIGMEVTNPDAPMTNAVEIGRIAFNLAPWPLLERKVIIEEMAVQKLRFDTPRKTSGAIEKKERKPDKADGKERITIAGFELPSAQEILEREELTSIAEIRELNERIEKMRTEWKQRIDGLPGPEKIESYRGRAKEIKAGGEGVSGAVSTAAKIRELKKEITADRDRIKSAYADYRKELADLREQVDAARQAPVEEARRLMDKYAVSPAGGVNLTRLLFGDKLAGWVASALKWHERLKPFYDRAVEKADEPKKVKPLRAKGIDVIFRERSPKPDFLIRLANLSAETKKGNFDGTVRNITGQQHLVGKPLQFDLGAEKLTGLESARLQGSFDRTEPRSPQDTIDATVRGYRAEGLQLSSSGKFPVRLEKGLANLDLDAELASGRLRAKIDGRIREAALKVEPKEPNELTGALASALQGVSAASLSADVKGTPQDYDISLSSDLEQVLQQAVGNILREKARGLKDELRGRIAERASEPLDKLDGRFGDFVDVKGTFDRRIDNFEGLLSDLASSEGGIKLPF